MIKDNHIWTYYVDPEKRIIQHRQIPKEDWYEYMRKHIGCRLIESHKVLDNPPVRWFGDEEGLLKNEQDRYFFQFKSVQNLSTEQFIPDNTRLIKKYREYYSEPYVWEFCGRGFFASYYVTDDDETLESVQLQLWEFVQCIEFMHHGYQVEPMTEIRFFE